MENKNKQLNALKRAVTRLYIAINQLTVTNGQPQKTTTETVEAPPKKATSTGAKKVGNSIRKAFRHQYPRMQWRNLNPELRKQFQDDMRETFGSNPYETRAAIAWIKIYKDSRKKQDVTRSR